MSTVAVQKCKTSNEIPQDLLDYSDTITDLVRQRAFELFQGRNGMFGTDLSDWLEAEKDIVHSPASELVDDKKEFRARLEMPGFVAKDIQVSASPDLLIVKADSIHTHKEDDFHVQFCELSENARLRRFALPSHIDVDNVTASLDNGILQINARKAASAQRLPPQLGKEGKGALSWQR